MIRIERSGDRIAVKGWKRWMSSYMLPKIKDSMNLVYPSKTIQKANFAYTKLADIGLHGGFKKRGMIM